MLTALSYHVWIWVLMKEAYASNVYPTIIVHLDKDVLITHIDSVCRCTPGQLLEPCTNNNDCASGLCGITELGQVCIPMGGECISNYNGTGGIRICPVSRPYCVNGTCSTTSLGAVCGA